MLDEMEPKTLAKWLIALAILYLVLPYDLLPDFLGLPGRIDDLLIMAWLLWFYRAHLGKRGRAERPSEAPRQASSSPALDPYEVLGIPRSATSEAIRTAYRARMQAYHPDKVAHLGEDLQKLATEKSQQIQRAYQQLRR